MKNNNKTYRMFSIVQREQFLSKEMIEEIVFKYKSIDMYAYILHDKDIYDEDDELQNPNHKANTHKANHWHIFIKLKTNAMSTLTIANWFNVPCDRVQGLGGKEAIADAVEYMIHECYGASIERKFHYDDNEIIANFNWKNLIAKKIERKANAMNKNRDYHRFEILNNGMTLNQIKAENPMLFSKEHVLFDKTRKKYIDSYMDMPLLRLNFYIHGEGGSGKNIMSKALARALYPNIKKDEDIFCEAGADGVSFDSYDGQPVIIWNDTRGLNLRTRLGGKGNVFDIFDIHPSNKSQNIKFGKIRLCNEINIVNSVQTYGEFVEELACEEDKKQVYRRFTFLLNIKENTYDFFIEEGTELNDKKKCGQYRSYKDEPFLIEEIMNCYKFDKVKRDEFSSKSISFVVDRCKSIFADFFKEPDDIEQRKLEIEKKIDLYMKKHNKM